MRYVSQRPLMMDVHMHKPTAISRNFMDALLAFWPGLQVYHYELFIVFISNDSIVNVTAVSSITRKKWHCKFCTVTPLYYLQKWDEPVMFQHVYLLHEEMRWRCKCYSTLTYYLQKSNKSFSAFWCVNLSEIRWQFGTL